MRLAELLRTSYFQKLLKLLDAILLQRLLTREAADFSVRFIEPCIGNVQLAVQAGYLSLQRVSASLCLVSDTLLITRVKLREATTMVK